MSAAGFNPIRWNCTVQGCFNYHRHFDIEHFAQCFPRSIGLTDLDGFVEVGGHFLIAEFKDRNANLTEGQRIAFERLTAASPRITVLVVRCEYRSSEVFELKVIREGNSAPWRPCTLDQLTAYLSQWASRCDGERVAA